MTPGSEPPPQEDAPSNIKLVVDYGPVLVFVILYNILRRSDPDGAIFTAAGVFAGVATIALLWSRLKLGKFSGILLFTTGIIILTVALAYLFDDPRFIYMKPTVVNAVFGLLAIGGVAIGRNPIKLLVGNAVTLSDAAWNKFAIRWGLFFFACAALNEIIWRAMSEAFWANFKLFGFIPLTLLFTFSQIPFLMKHGALAADAADNG